MKSTELENKNGIMVTELIHFLQSLPKAEHEDDEGEVWVETSQGVSDLCYSAVKLNKNDVLLRLTKEKK
jgi:hypothetical protein